MRLLLAISLSIATLAQTPIDVPVVPSVVIEWVKSGTFGIAMFIVWWLIAKTLPAQDAAHVEACKSIADASSKGLSEVKDAIEEGTQRQCDILNQALGLKRQTP